MSEAITLACKTCGREFVLPEGKLLFPCPACGTSHSRPRATGNALADLRRAHQQRAACDFVNAEANYQRVLNAHPDEAEALWGLALCKYGVEYVRDNRTGDSLPVVHFLNRRPFTEDPDCRLAIARAGAELRPEYLQDAAYIARIQQEVLAAEQRGDVWDIFLCYKSSVPGAADPDVHTREFAHAQDLYLALRDAGYSVFFAHTTLRHAAGANYEAKIFHALQSAKVMLVVTSDPAHLDTPWVHSEWSRYLERVDAHEDCRLIPLLYDRCDPYDLPDAFLRRSIQGLPMGSLTALDDLRRVLDERLKRDVPTKSQPEPTAPGVAPLLRRVALFLEDGDWRSADDYCEKVLDIDPECARAYVGKLMAALQVTRQEKLRDQPQPFDQNPNYIKAVRFADEALAAELRGMIAHINERNEYAAKDAAYQKAEAALKAAKSAQGFLTAQELFAALGDHRDAPERAKACETARLDWLYQQAESALNAAKSEQGFITAQEQFAALGNHRDAPERAKACVAARLDWLYQQAESAQNAAKSEQGFLTAQEQFAALGNHRDAPERAKACVAARLDWLYQQADSALNAAKSEQGFIAAQKQFAALGNHRDAPERAKQCANARKNFLYDSAMNHMRGKPDKAACNEAIRLLQTIPDWRDAPQKIEACRQRIRDIEAEEARRAAEEKARREARRKAWQAKIPAIRAAGLHPIAAGGYHTVGLCADEANALAPRRWWWFSKPTASPRKSGTVVAVGTNRYNQCNVSGWSDVVAIAAGYWHTVSLRADGSVISDGANGAGQRDVSGWSDVVAIDAGCSHTIGLRADGSVIAVGYNNFGQCDVSDWSDVIAITAGTYHTIGLQADSSVVAVGYNDFGQCDVTGWSDIVAIAAGESHTVGLRADGSVVAVGYNDDGRCNVTGWSDVVAIAAGESHTVGLRADGSVVAVGSNGSGRCDVTGWSDVVAIAAGESHTVGLRADGSVVAVGDNRYGQCNVTGWRLRQVPRPTLPE